MITVFQNTVKNGGQNGGEAFSENTIGSWTHLENPTIEEIGDLSKKFTLDKAHLTDALDPYEGARLEVEDGCIYIFTRVPLTENGEVFTSPLLIVLGGRNIFTISKKPLSLLDKFQTSTTALSTTHRTKLVLQFFAHINAQYNTFIGEINKKVQNTRAQMEHIRSKDIVQFVTFESTLNDFMSALVPTSTVLDRLLSGKYIELLEEDKELVEDLLLSTRQLIDRGNLHLKTITNVREAYSTIMTHKLNQVIKLFTGLTIVLTIPTVIGSIFGMNVPIPFAHSQFAFISILGGIVLLSLTVLIIFFLKRWL